MYCTWKPRFSSLTQSCLTLWPHGLQHTRLPCPLPIPGACSNSCPSVMPSNHLTRCHPLLLLPSIFPSIRIFSNESIPCIRRANVTFYKCKRGHTTSKLEALQWLLFSLRLHSQLFVSGQQCSTAWWGLRLHLQTLLFTTYLFVPYAVFMLVFSSSC